MNITPGKIHKNPLCKKCGRDKVVAEQSVSGFPGYRVKGSRIEYCCYCDDVPVLTLHVGVDKVELEPID